MKVIAPVRCPHCRSRLRSKYMPYLGRLNGGVSDWVRWCPRCRCTVAYEDRQDGWYMLGAMRDID